MTFLKLAPFAQSWDMWLALFFCYFSSVIWLYFAYKASKSGSKVKKSTWDRGGYIWVDSDENVPFHKTGWFAFFCLHIVLGSFFFGQCFGLTFKMYGL